MERTVSLIMRKFKEWRIENSISQEKAAELLYVSYQTVSAWEKGRHEPKAEQVERILTLMNGRYEFPSGLQSVRYRTIWDGGTVFETNASFNPKTNEITNIGGVEADFVECLDEEYILFENDRELVAVEFNDKRYARIPFFELRFDKEKAKGIFNELQKTIPYLQDEQLIQSYTSSRSWINTNDENDELTIAELLTKENIHYQRPLDFGLYGEFCVSSMTFCVIGKGYRFCFVTSATEKEIENVFEIMKEHEPLISDDEIIPWLHKCGYMAVKVSNDAREDVRIPGSW